MSYAKVSIYIIIASGGGYVLCQFETVNNITNGNRNNINMSANNKGVINNTNTTMGANKGVINNTNTTMGANKVVININNNYYNTSVAFVREVAVTNIPALRFVNTFVGADFFKQPAVQLSKAKNLLQDFAHIPRTQRLLEVIGKELGK